MSSDSTTRRSRFASDTDHTVALVKLKRFCKDSQFCAADEARVLTATSELMRNVLKYARRGHLEFAAIEEGFNRGVRVTVTDNGPGIANLDDALQPGFSTSGTLGLGLSGAKKLVDHFQIETQRGQGTKIVLHVWKSRDRRRVN